jgi:hypothetical protein
LAHVIENDPGMRVIRGACVQVINFLSCSRNRAWHPPTSSSLAEERNASARSSSARRRAISRRSQLSAAGSLLLDPVRQFRNLIEHAAPLGHQRADLTISVHDGGVITTSELLSDLGQ